MVWLNRFSSIGMKFVIILAVFIRHAHAAPGDDATQSSASTAPTTQSSASTAPTTQSSVTTAPTTQSSVTTAPTTQSSVSTMATTQPTTPGATTVLPSTTAIGTTAETTTSQTTPSELPASSDTTPKSVETSPTSIITETSEFFTGSPTTDPTIITTTSVTNNSNCYPDDFPFSGGCISPQDTAGVVITALVLSLISFVGALVGFSYMLYTKFFHARGSRIRTNADVPLKGMGNGNHRAGGQPAAANPRVVMQLDDAF